MLIFAFSVLSFLENAKTGIYSEVDIPSENVIMYRINPLLSLNKNVAYTHHKQTKTLTHGAGEFPINGQRHHQWTQHS